MLIFFHFLLMIWTILKFTKSPSNRLATWPSRCAYGVLNCLKCFRIDKWTKLLLSETFERQTTHTHRNFNLLLEFYLCKCLPIKEAMINIVAIDCLQ